MPTLKPEIEVIALKNPWSRERHHARVMPALGAIIDIAPTPRVVPGVIARQPPRPEERRNRRVGPVRLMVHQLDRAISYDARAERRALAAANEALEPMSRTWWARLSRALRGLMGGRG